MKKKFLLPFIFIAVLICLSVSGQLLSPASASGIQDQRHSQEHLARQTLKGRVIVVDPGHGGNDAGAIGPHKVTEKNITLDIARNLRELLSKDGATVIMTRNSDHNVAGEEASDVEELQARADIANQANADLFISIHADSSQEMGSGTTTYFCSGSNSSLAQLVQSNMVSQLKLYNRGSLPSEYYVLKHTNMPAILTEVAFISNPTEERLLTSRDFKKKAALGIYNGIKQFLI